MERYISTSIKRYLTRSRTDKVAMTMVILDLLKHCWLPKTSKWKKWPSENVIINLISQSIPTSSINYSNIKAAYWALPPKQSIPQKKVNQKWIWMLGNLHVQWNIDYENLTKSKYTTLELKDSNLRRIFGILNVCNEIVRLW